MSSNNNNNNMIGQFGDTTLTKVFVGGLAWETPKEAMREHFEKYGEILEAVIISDKITGRSKGYGFVTFKEPESAKKACEDASPIINGRRANCNLASLGARRPRSAASTTPPQQGSNVGPRSTSSAVPANQVQWYYPAAAATGTHASHPFHHQQHHPHHHAVPFYGYSPTYIATDVSYNHKMSYTGGGGGGSYGHYTQAAGPQVYPGQGAIVGAMPMYPLYHFHHHQSQTMGLPAHIFQPTSVGPMTTVPTTIMSKPPSIAVAPPNTVCLTVE